MTQEIYDYLLTREKIIKLSEKELITETQVKDNFPSIIKFIHDIIYRENIFLLNENYYMKIEKYLNEFRYSYLSDKDLNPLMNEIIMAISIYRNMSVSEKTKYIINWKVKESVDRNIPNSYFISNDELISYVLADSYYLKILLDNDLENIKEVDPKKMLSTFMVLSKQFLKVFIENKESLELSIRLANYLKNITDDRKIKKMAKVYIREVSYDIDNYEMSKIKNKEF